MRQYSDIKEISSSSKVAEAAVYALPQHQSTQQATMDAIMLMYSTLDDQNKRTISLRISHSAEVSDEDLDEMLAEKLSTLPSWDEVHHTNAMDNLTKDDYTYAMKEGRHKPMKGIEKWL